MAGCGSETVKGWHWGGGFAAAFVFALVFLQSEDRAAPELPPELQDEPDVYIDGAVITQFREDGALRYRIASDEIRQYERRGLATLEAPALDLYPPEEAPWHASADRGVLRTVPGPSGVPEEQLLLRGNVVLRRDLGAGGALIVSTASLYVYPERQFARTDRPVMIEAPGRRGTAAGFEGDLERGWMRLSSAPGQRVHIIMSGASPPRPAGGEFSRSGNSGATGGRARSPGAASPPGDGA